MGIRIQWTFKILLAGALLMFASGCVEQLITPTTTPTGKPTPRPPGENPPRIAILDIVSVETEGSGDKVVLRSVTIRVRNDGNSRAEIKEGSVDVNLDAIDIGAQKIYFNAVINPGEIKDLKSSAISISLAFGRHERPHDYWVTVEIAVPGGEPLIPTYSKYITM